MLVCSCKVECGGVQMFNPASRALLPHAQRRKGSPLSTMSDPIDRVFVKAITTIRALSTRSSYGALPRPPAENRIKLYGLYKQATEGNVCYIMERPQGHTLEDEGAKKKWDAWKREEGTSKTDAKRQYIMYLIDTMRVYGSSTAEARELLSELEYLWEQIKDVGYVDGEEAWYLRGNALPLNVDQLERFSTGTPWPPTNYAPLVAPLGMLAPAQNQSQYRSNLEQIYLHSRRNTQLSLNEGLAYLMPVGRARGARGAPGGASGASGAGIASGAGGAGGASGAPAKSIPESALDDFRTWQGEINSVVNKLSREYLGRRRTGALASSESELESDLDPKDRLKRRIWAAAKVLGVQVFRVLKNLCVSTLAILFLVWCLKKNVVVESTIVHALGRRKELVVNMAMNPDENKWFVRLLRLVNSFVGFV